MPFGWTGDREKTNSEVIQTDSRRRGKKLRKSCNTKPPKTAAKPSSARERKAREAHGTPKLGEPN